MSDHKNVFNDIYLNDRWRSSREESSPIEHNSQIYAPFIEMFIKNNHIKSIVDIGCGNWEWFKNIDLHGADYMGIDVSDVVLEIARKNAPAGTKFKNINVLQESLPKADLLLMKDVLQHWSNADVLSFIPKLSNFKYALITNGFALGDETHGVNIDIAAGEFRPVDLTSQPFDLRGPYIFSFEVSPTEIKKIIMIEAGGRRSSKLSKFFGG